MLDAFERLAATVHWARPRIGVVSNLTGRLRPRRRARQRRATGAGTCASRCASPTAAGAARGRAARSSSRSARRPTLAGHGRPLSAGGRLRLAALAAPGRDDWDDDARAAWPRCTTRGVPVDWAAFDRGYRRRRVALPTYPFQRERYWVERRARVARAEQRGADGRRTRCSASGCRSALDTVQFESVIGPRQLAFLGEHRVHGAALAPGVGLPRDGAGGRRPRRSVAPSAVEDLRILSPLMLPEDGERVVQVLATPDDRARRVEVVIASLASDGHRARALRRHVTARGLVRPAEAPPLAAEPGGTSGPAAPKTSMGERHYARLAGQGIELGPSFRGLGRLWRRDGEALGRDRAAGVGRRGGDRIACTRRCSTPAPGRWRGVARRAGRGTLPPGRAPTGSICGRRLPAGALDHAVLVRPGVIAGGGHRRRHDPRRDRSACWREARRPPAAARLPREALTALTEAGADWSTRSVAAEAAATRSGRRRPAWRARPRSPTASTPELAALATAHALDATTRRCAALDAWPPAT